MRKIKCPKCYSENIEQLNSRLIFGYHCKDCDFLFDPQKYQTIICPQCNRL